MRDHWFHKIFSVAHPGFEQLALDVFRFQYQYNPVYRAYTDLLNVDPGSISTFSQIPFLPIQFFKTHSVTTTDFEPEAVFESSGTTRTLTSHHFVRDIEWYRQSFLKGFELFYGPVKGWCIIALLPSYFERKRSSLVFMANEMIQQSRQSQSGFYLKEYDKLYRTLRSLEAEKQKTLLIGASFALLDFAEQYPLPLEHTIVMETGGMKGRRKEMVRSELHELLKQRFTVNVIHSEYGMTELLSQAYSIGEGIFQGPSWMRILIRGEDDPFQITGGSMQGQIPELPAKGAINIIDLANIYSCSFIATDDAGVVFSDGSFEVLGRLDNTDVRGCSLMAM